MDSRLILFDVDGTLIDTAGAGRIAMERACHRLFGIDNVSARASGVRYAGMTDPVILQSVAAAIGVPPGEYEARKEPLRLAFLEELRSVLRRPEPRRHALPGVRELLAKLHGRDDTYLGLITGNLEEGAWAKLDALELSGYFPGGGFGSDHPDRREIARLARLKLCELTGVTFSADRVVVVGDTEHDIDCAKANGFRAVAVASGWIDRDELEQARPDALLDDFTDEQLVYRAFGLA